MYDEMHYKVHRSIKTSLNGLVIINLYLRYYKKFFTNEEMSKGLLTFQTDLIYGLGTRNPDLKSYKEL